MSDVDNRTEAETLDTDTVPPRPLPDSAPPADIERVGYKNPPQHSRFKPGQSGNRRGRPKGTMNFADTFRKVMNEPLTLPVGGKLKKKRGIEVALLALRNKAMKGDPRALKLVLDLVDKLKFDDGTQMGTVFKIVVVNPENPED